MSRRQEIVDLATGLKNTYNTNVNNPVVFSGIKQA